MNVYSPEMKKDILNYKECLVCFTPIKKQISVTNECFHFFCPDCTKRWVSKSSTCPLCRTPLNCYAKLLIEDEQIHILSVHSVRNREYQYDEDYYTAEEVICCDNCLSKYSTKCTRTYVEGMNFLVQCDQCKCWYHGGCVGFTRRRNIPECYICQNCLMLPDLVPLDVYNDFVLKGHKLSKKDFKQPNSP